MPFVIQDILIHLPTEPFLYQGATFVSLREVVEELGGNSTIFPMVSRATALIGPWTATIIAGSPDATVEGMGHNVTVALGAAPYLQESEMFVPVDAFAELFGYEVRIEGTTVTIVNPAAT